MIRKIAALTLAFTLIVGLAGAQELGVELDGGLQGMRYPLQNGKSKILPGASLGVNYVFPLYNNVGLLTGVTAGLYGTQATMPNSMAFAYPRVDDEGSAFLYDVRLTGYKETQRTLAVTIPVLLHYHTDGDPVQWYFDAGAKIFLPASTTIKASAQQLSLSGYYPNYDLVISDLPKHGFGMVNGWTSSTSMQLKPGAALSAGTGFGFGISPGMKLYAGVYVDYGLTVLKTTGDSMPMVTYSPSGIGSVKANGVFNTTYAGQPKLLSFGLQVRLTWGARTAARHAARTKIRDTTQAEIQFTVRTKTQDAAQPVTANAAQSQTATTAQSQTTDTAQSQTADAAQSPTPDIVPVKTKHSGRSKNKPVTIAPAPASAPLSDSDLLTLQQPVVFGILGEAVIPGTQLELLDDMASIMQQHPDLRISIVGYTCDGVQQTEDVKLGEARAKAVARYLQRKGIDRRRMDIGYNKEGEPSTSYDPASNYRERRVLISPE